MNNSILIKGANFDAAKVGKLRIQKITITKDQNGGVEASNGQIVTMTDGQVWKPSEELAYSTEIEKPANAKYLFGKLNMVVPAANLQTFIETPGARNIITDIYPWIYHNSQTSLWRNVNGFYFKYGCRPQILGSKSPVYGSYASAIFDGNIYGEEMIDEIDKIIVNWIRPDSLVSTEMGLLVPELYWGLTD